LESGFPLTEDLAYIGEDFAERVGINPIAVTFYSQCFLIDHINPRRQGRS